MAENIVLFPQINTGGDYLNEVLKQLDNAGIEYQRLDEDFKVKKLDGQDFYSLRVLLSVGGLKVRQQYYATIMKGFCLSIVTNFDSKESKMLLDHTIQSFKRSTDS